MCVPRIWDGVCINLKIAYPRIWDGVCINVKIAPLVDSSQNVRKGIDIFWFSTKRLIARIVPLKDDRADLARVCPPNSLEIFNESRTCISPWK